MIIKNKNTQSYQIINHKAKYGIINACNLQYNKMIGFYKEKHLINSIKNIIKKSYEK
jgi:hypothetical protein